MMEETYGTQFLFRRRYACENGKPIRKSAGPLIQRSSNFIKEVFLPSGYPESVSKDYMLYQFWDTTQAFCSSITGNLATLAILKGVGVGDSSATPLAASITWMLKDATGMMGRILFAWIVATDLDNNSKFWRLVADFLNDLANLLELLAPMFPNLFLLIVILASLAKAVVSTAGSATRAAFVQHQAHRDNMADVAAKDGSQETVVNLVALQINLFLTPLVADKSNWVWFLFLVFTFLHLLANYQAVRVITMETLNMARLHLVLSSYLTTGEVPSVAKINAKEPIILWTDARLRYKLGVPLSDVLKSGEDYEEAIHRRSLAIMKYSGHCVHVALHAGSNVLTQLKAALAVEIVDHLIETDWTSQSPTVASLLDLKGDIPASLKFAKRLVESITVFSNLSLQLEEAGWVTSRLQLGTGEWRYSWLHVPLTPEDHPHSI